MSTTGSKKSAKNILRLSDLQNMKVRAPPELAEIGYSIVIRVQTDGSLIPEMVEKISIGEPIDDVVRLNQARQVVSSVENAAKRADKIEGSNNMMMYLLGTDTPKIAEHYHADRVRYHNYALNIIKNVEDVDKIPDQHKQAWIKHFIKKQGICALAAIEEYLSALLISKKLTLADSLKNQGATQWAFDKLGTGYLNFRVGDDPLKLLYPKSGNFFYLTVEEILTENVLQQSLLAFDDLSKAFFEPIRSKTLSTYFQVDPDAIDKQAEEYKKLRVFVPRNFTLSEMKEITSLPPDRSGTSGKFAELANLNLLIFRLTLGIPPLEVNFEKFFKLYDKGFSLDPKTIERPRDQFLRHMTKEKNWQLLVASLHAFSFDKTLPGLFPQEESKLFKLADKQNPVLKYYMGAKNNISAQVLKDREKIAAPFFIRPGKVDIAKGRTASSVLSRTGKEFCNALLANKATENLVEGVQNYLRSFRHQKMADQAVKIMAAQLESGGITLDDDELESNSRFALNIRNDEEA